MSDHLAVVAVRQVALPGRGVLGADQRNGIAVAPAARRLWVTVRGVVLEFPQAEGVMLEIPAFEAPVVGRKEDTRRWSPVVSVVRRWSPGVLEGPRHAPAALCEQGGRVCHALGIVSMVC